MVRTSIIDEELNGVAAHLRARRPAILQAWRAAADADPQLTTANSLPQSQFNDHIPQVLDVFERRLQVWPQDPQLLDEEQKGDAVAHGLQRWHQGYRLREITREWGHLQLVLLDELERYSTAQTDRSPVAMAIARRAWSEVCVESVSDSASEYFELEKLEADGNVRDLAQTLKDERKLERDRTELWRQAAHDLRGHVGTVVNAATGLGSRVAPEPIREKFLLLLQRSTSSLHMMLDDVMNLARLQAGHEQLEVRPFDAARLLRDLCEALHTQADERGLYLELGGPDALMVEGDAVKTRRVAQNLLINALRYTLVGGVTVNWGDSRENDPERWMFSVRDTGPGFHAGPGAPLVGALKAATIASHEIDRDAGVDPVSADTNGSALDDDQREVSQQRGEGVGLSIVKRLSDLLHATIELESGAEVGTIFRVILPRRYQPQPPQ
ncbi:MAG TPA: HAMP domain-containing sensor histidine kinase [Burkholderiaceae bacterium]|nr:HAMP domain-containing sensor histidine kinase [Burkholderiaceae bacterium]